MTVAKQLLEKGFAPLPASEVGVDRHGLDELQETFADLVLDDQMGDGGRYRFRRYSRFLLDSERRELTPLAGTSIYQSLEDNPLNGGRTRTFEPLRSKTASSPLLRSLIWFDFGQLPTEGHRWAVGVHQVRIQAWPGRPGQPTPEGIHIDAEEFTVQHLLARRNVDGGAFQAFDHRLNPTFEWLQTEPLDSVFFTGKTLHSASPIMCHSNQAGYRDILLIDFDHFS